MWNSITTCSEDDRQPVYHAHQAVSKVRMIAMESFPPPYHDDHAGRMHDYHKTFELSIEATAFPSTPPSLAFAPVSGGVRLTVLCFRLHEDFKCSKARNPDCGTNYSPLSASDKAILRRPPTWSLL
jgi:hypothetical protein